MARRDWRPGVERARRTELHYARQLRKIARHIADIVLAFPVADPAALPPMQQALDNYGRAIEPWALSVTNSMHEQVDAKDLAAWMQLTEDMRQGLKRELREAPTGHATQRLLLEQVDLITSLPRWAGERVHEWTLEGITDSTRAAEIAAAIRATSDVTQSRANLIARTEVARTASVLCQARAEHVGSTEYVWRSSGDADVRPTHRKLNGTVQKWSSPPLCDLPDYHAHAGAIFNCFPGSTQVSLAHGCHHLFRHWYEGPLVVIQHEAGLLELTPNHPILTGRGWVAAEQIDAGDYIFQAVEHVAFEVDEDQRHPTFSEVFAALETVLNCEANSRFVCDFHGYVPDEDVNTIRAEHYLPGDGMPKTLQAVRDATLSGADRRVLEARIGRSAAHVREPHLAGGDDILGARLRGHGLHPADVGLASGPALHAVPSKNAGNGEPGATQAQRQRQLALARAVRANDLRLVEVCALDPAAGAPNYHAPSAEILADNVGMIADVGRGIGQGGTGLYKPLRVINTARRDFADHVFTMETVTGWFSVTPAGVIAKNCRCYPEPIIPE